MEPQSRDQKLEKHKRTRSVRWASLQRSGATQQINTPQKKKTRISEVEKLYIMGVEQRSSCAAKGNTTKTVKEVP